MAKKDDIQRALTKMLYQYGQLQRAVIAKQLKVSATTLDTVSENNISQLTGDVAKLLADER